jgi:DNA repair protein RecO (recombination protein O)
VKYTCKAVALTYIKYNDTSIISKLFTEKKGLQSFLVKGVYSKKSRKKIGFFQPLQLIHISAYHKLKSSLHHLNEVSIAEAPFTNNLNSSFLSLFIAEVLSKTLQENIFDNNLFQFIWKTKIDLNSMQKIPSNYTLDFLINLSGFFGFKPLHNSNKNSYFDLEKGVFIRDQNKHTLNKNKSYYLSELLLNKNIEIPKPQIKELLNDLILYYKYQHHEIKNLSSHSILESLNK